MRTKNFCFKPMSLDNSNNVIIEEGYYTCIITEVYEFEQNEKPVLKMVFEVSTGRYRGFRISTKFFDTFKSRIRLTHLCNAVGVNDRLNSPDDLVGRKMRAKIVPKKNQFNDRLFYLITRFDPLDDK